MQSLSASTPRGELSHGEQGACLSVILPVYNVAPWLRRCLESICGQTYASLEIICVDDGSQDASPDILREFAARDARIIIITQPNGGVSAARNAGLERATGQWVAFPDADDWLLPHAYATAMAHTDGVDMVQFGTRIEPGDAEVDCRELQERYTLRQGGLFRQSERCNEHVPMMVFDKVMRRSVIEENGLRFHPEIRIGEDRTFLMEFRFCSARAFVLTEPLYCYFQRASSAMHSAEIAGLYLPNCLRMHACYHRLLQRPGVSREYLSLYAARLERDFWGVTEGSRGVLTEEEVREHFRRLSNRYKLWRYPELRWALGEMRVEPWWSRLFVSHRRSTTVWRLFGIPLLKRTSRAGYETYRLLGIPVRKVPVASAPKTD